MSLVVARPLDSLDVLSFYLANKAFDRLDELQSAVTPGSNFQNPSWQLSLLEPVSGPPV